MNNSIVYSGEDKAITISIFDDAGNPINLDDLTDIILYIISGNTRHIRVSKTSGELWVKIDEFTYRYVIDSSVTKTLPYGDYVGEVNVVSASDLVDDQKLNSIGREPLFSIRKSLVGNES